MTIKVAVSLPITPGVKVTLIVHDFRAPSVDLQVPPLTVKSAAFGPLMLWLREIVTLCVLSTVTVLVTLVPNVVPEIVKLAGVTVTN